MDWLLSVHTLRLLAWSASSPEIAPAGWGRLSSNHPAFSPSQSLIELDFSVHLQPAMIRGRLLPTLLDACSGGESGMLLKRGYPFLPSSFVPPTRPLAQRWSRSRGGQAGASSGAEHTSLLPRAIFPLLLLPQPHGRLP
ncbi:hypothetical protein CGRA01v4_05753 [Colletotrichum graminicola]|nr:hypothetical protein CGRA01v4_05753 [Colletotrichum graminicola]